jgi:hypothetical protein
MSGTSGERRPSSRVPSIVEITPAECQRFVENPDRNPRNPDEPMVRDTVLFNNHRFACLIHILRLHYPRFRDIPSKPAVLQKLTELFSADSPIFEIYRDYISNPSFRFQILSHFYDNLEHIRALQTSSIERRPVTATAATERQAKTVLSKEALNNLFQLETDDLKNIILNNKTLPLLSKIERNKIKEDLYRQEPKLYATHVRRDPQRYFNNPTQAQIGEFSPIQYLNIYDNLIQQQFSQESPKKGLKVRIYTILMTLLTFLKSILIFENNPKNYGDVTGKNEILYLNKSQYSNLMKEIDHYLKYLKPKSTMTMQYTFYENYTALYMMSWKTYLGLRAIEEYPYTRFTAAQWLDFIKILKAEWIPTLGLQYILQSPNSSKIIQEWKRILLEEYSTNNPYLDLIVYALYWVNEPVTHNKVIHPMKGRAYHPPCVIRMEGIYSDDEKKYTEVVMPMIEACTVLNSEIAILKNYRTMIQRELAQVFRYYNPRLEIHHNLHPAYILNIHDVKREMALVEFFALWYDSTMGTNGIKPMTFWRKYYDTTFEGEIGVYVGVEQDLFQTSLNQLKEWGVFVPTEPGGSRYILNTKWRMTDDQLNRFNERQTHIPVVYFDKKLRKHFYKFIGGLFARTIMMGLEVPFALSFYTLGMLYNPEHKDPFYDRLYYWMDYPKESRTRFDLLKYDTETMAELDMRFNDSYAILHQPLKKNPGSPAAASAAPASQKASARSPKTNPRITPKNVLTYVSLYGKYILERGIHEENPTLPDKQRKIYMDSLKMMGDGFYINTKGFLVNSNEIRAIHILDKMCHSGGLQEADLEVFKRCIRVELSEIEPMMTPQRQAYLRALRPYQEKLANEWINALLNPQVEIPYDKIGELSADKIPKTKEEKLQFYYRSFLPKLLYFWTSSRTLQPKQVYLLKCIVNDPADAEPLTAGRAEAILRKLPISHTCFYTLDIPTFNLQWTDALKKELETATTAVTTNADEDALKSFIEKHCINNVKDSVNALIEKLVISIYSNVGFGLAGGSRRSKKC